MLSLLCPSRAASVVISMPALLILGNETVEGTIVHYDAKVQAGYEVTMEIFGENPNDDVLFAIGMIDTPATFIVGAGASKPYGLPTGARMRIDAGNLTAESHLYRFIRLVLVRRDPTFKVDFINEFFQDLKDHTVESIDEYLEKRRVEPFATIGRVTIAALMGDALRSAKPRPAENEDWLLHIFRRMARGIDAFPEFVEKNRCRFITFNFDSFIEDRLLQLLTTTYGRNAVTSNPFSVIHVHGMLSLVPLETMEFEQFLPGKNVYATAGT